MLVVVIQISNQLIKITSIILIRQLCYRTSVGSGKSHCVIPVSWRDGQTVVSYIHRLKQNIHNRLIGLGNLTVANTSLVGQSQLGNVSSPMNSRSVFGFWRICTVLNVEFWCVCVYVYVCILGHKHRRPREPSKGSTLVALNGPIKRLIKDISLLVGPK